MQGQAFSYFVSRRVLHNLPRRLYQQRKKIMFPSVHFVGLDLNMSLRLAKHLIGSVFVSNVKILVLLRTNSLSWRCVEFQHIQQIALNLACAKLTVTTVSTDKMTESTVSIQVNSDSVSHVIATLVVLTMFN